MLGALGAIPDCFGWDMGFSGTEIKICPPKQTNKNKHKNPQTNQKTTPRLDTAINNLPVYLGRELCVLTAALSCSWEETAALWLQVWDRNLEAEEGARRWPSSATCLCHPPEGSWGPQSLCCVLLLEQSSPAAPALQLCRETPGPEGSEG